MFILVVCNNWSTEIIRNLDTTVVVVIISIMGLPLYAQKLYHCLSDNKTLGVNLRPYLGHQIRHVYVIGRGHLDSLVRERHIGQTVPVYVCKLIGMM